MSQLEVDSHPPRPLPAGYASLTPATSHGGPKGTIHCYQVEPDVLYTQVVGHLDVEGAKAYIAFAERALARVESVDTFHDWGEMTSYDSEARMALTKWTVDKRSAMRSVVILVRSKLVAMGVATANVATSPLGVTLNSHTERSAFENQFLEIMRAR